MIRAQVGTGRVICGLSGGVDSSVAPLLVHRAMGDQLHVRVRRPRPDAQERGRAGHLRLPRPLQGPAGASTPRIASWRACRAVASPRPSARRSAPSSSASSRRRRSSSRARIPASRARSTRRHRVRRRHRRGDDQVAPQRRRAAERPRVRARRAAARCSRTRCAPSAPSSGLPERLVWRQPFPGPGLAIRIVGGEATKARLDTLRDADAILQDEIRKAGLYRELWQSFCVLPDIRTVGVQGDERTYGYVVAIRAVTSDDAMTADWARLPYDLLERIASRMINEIREVNRVVLDITSKPRARSSGRCAEQSDLGRTRGSRARRARPSPPQCGGRSSCSRSPAPAATPRLPRPGPRRHARGPQGRHGPGAAVRRGVGDRRRGDVAARRR